MKKSPANDLRDRSQINSIFERHLSAEYWTPAQGALLMSWVTPEPKCLNIPPKGISLIHPNEMAEKSLLQDAEKTLQRWIDYWEDKDLAHPNLQKNAEISPSDFLQWCVVEFEGDSFYWPKALQYWLDLIEYPAKGDFPFATRTIIDYAIHLSEEKRFSADAVAADASQHALALNSKNVHFESGKQRLIQSLRFGRAVYLKVAIEAVKKTDWPLSNSEIWKNFKELVKSNEYPKLRFEENIVEITNNVGKWVPFPSGTLYKFLTRHKNDVEFNPDENAND